MKKLVVASLFVAGIFSLNSCARQGTPSGGPRDVTPPKLLGSNPDTLAVNVNPNIKEIEIDFDEYIQLKDFSKNVVISPPFERNPVVTPMTSADKRITIKLQEPLLPNSTYSFNFGEAIQDYNEGNKLSNFTYVISTGSYIDSLAIKGKVYSGYDFELPEKVLVGLYKVDQEFNDSIILKNKPYYVSRVNESGEYDLKFLKQGKYKLVAFEDKVENSKVDYGREKVGYNSDLIDLDSNQSINLKLFKTKPAYRVTKSEQKGYGHLVIRTEGTTSPVTISPVDRELKSLKIDAHPANDSINLWFDPKEENFATKSERLRFNVGHQGKTETATVLYLAPTLEYKPSYKASNDAQLAPNREFKLIGSAPIKKLDKSLINLFKDTIQIPFDAEIDSINQQIVNFKFRKELGDQFEVNIYPNALIDHFNQPNDTIVYQLKAGKREDFGNLKVRLQNLPELPVILQLIKNSSKYEVIEELKGYDRLFNLDNLTPGEYYIRLIVDENKNGVWDTGNLLENRQPEPVYLYPNKITVRPMWDTDETWIVGKDSEFVSPLPVKKPEENTTNKR